MHTHQPSIESLFNNVKKRANGKSQSEEDKNLQRSKKRGNFIVRESGTCQSDLLNVGNTRKLEDFSNGLEVA